MGTTSNRNYRYPESTSDVQIWEHVENLANDVDADMAATWGADWTDFSSTFTIVGGTTNPTLGTTVISAQWRFLNAHTVIDVVDISIGSGFSAGAGAYFFSLSHTPIAAEHAAMGSSYFFDSSPTAEYTGTVRITSGRAVLYIPAQNGTTTSGSLIKSMAVGGSGLTPTPASGDKYKYSITYRI